MVSIDPDHFSIGFCNHSGCRETELSDAETQDAHNRFRLVRISVAEFQRAVAVAQDNVAFFIFRIDSDFLIVVG